MFSLYGKIPLMQCTMIKKSC